MARTGPLDRIALRRTLTVTAAGLALGIPGILSGCGGVAGVAAPPTRAAPPFEPILLIISPDAATGPDFRADGRIEDADDVDYFELRVRRDFASVIVMTEGATDTAGRMETADREPITEPCATPRERPCVFSYDADTAPRSDRSAAFNRMPPSGNFVWEGNLPGPVGDAEYRVYYIRVTGENDSTGEYRLIVELNEGEGPMYS